MEGNALRFAHTAKALGRAARRLGLVAPAFRSPPARDRGTRSVRRSRDGATVSVAVRNRPWPAVMADMIEGVVVANELDDGTAGTVRDELWEAVESLVTAERPEESRRAATRTSGEQPRRHRESARPPGHAAAA